MSRRVWIFAVRSDVVRVLERVEQRTQLVYRQCFLGMSDVPTWNAAAEIEGLGTANAGGYIDQPTYLILPASVEFRLREIKLNAGGYRYAVDQFLNPDSVMLRAGGQYASECIVMGEFGTVSAKKSGFDLLETIRRVVKAEFSKVADSYVGPDAFAPAQSGLRLTDSTHAPVDHVLPLPAGNRNRR